MSVLSGKENAVSAGYSLLKMRQPPEPGRRYRAKASPYFRRNLHTLVFSQPQRRPRASRVSAAPIVPNCTVGAIYENALLFSCHTVWHQRSSHASASPNLIFLSASRWVIFLGRQMKP